MDIFRTLEGAHIAVTSTNPNAQRQGDQWIEDKKVVAEVHLTETGRWRLKRVNNGSNGPDGQVVRG